MRSPLTRDRWRRRTCARTASRCSESLNSMSSRCPRSAAVLAAAMASCRPAMLCCMLTIRRRRSAISSCELVKRRAAAVVEAGEHGRHHGSLHAPEPDECPQWRPHAPAPASPLVVAVLAGCQRAWSPPPRQQPSARQLAQQRGAVRRERRCRVLPHLRLCGCRIGTLDPDGALQGFELRGEVLPLPLHVTSSGGLRGRANKWHCRCMPLTVAALVRAERRRTSPHLLEQSCVSGDEGANRRHLVVPCGS